MVVVVVVVVREWDEDDNEDYDDNLPFDDEFPMDEGRMMVGVWCCDALYHNSVEL